jgi:hypothetical protein
MHPDSREKTAFNVEGGHYEYLRLPMGLRNSAATFQRMVDGVLRGLKPTQCLVYLDDVVVFGASIEEHAERLRNVLDRLREAKLSLKLEKCHFARERVKYLGHVIDRKGVSPDPEKVQAVMSYPAPNNIKEVQSFLGLANYYRRFIGDYAMTARPLTRLLKKGATFSWSPECEKAFGALKRALAESPVLVYPDFEKKFILSTDASSFAVGAVLSQEIDGVEHPVAYASRQLNSAEANYTVSERELVAVVWAVQYFRCYLYGRKFTIYTDHAALQWLFSLRDPNSRLMRWTLKLSEYEYEVVHKPGKMHLNADGLSRKVRLTRVIGAEDVLSSQSGDAECGEWKSKRNFVEIEGVLCRRTNGGNRVVLPSDLRDDVIRQCHEHALSGHLGVRATVDRVAQQYWWPSIRRDVQGVIEECIPCNRRSPYGRTKAPLQALPDTAEPFELVAMDIIGPLPVTERGNKYVLSVIDHFSRYLELIPLENQTASMVAEAFVRRWVVRFGVPEKLLTDQGSNFMSELFASMCKELQITQLRTSPFHPQSNGRCERVHRTVSQILSHYVNAKGNDWDRWLAFAVSAYNTSKHSSTEFSPHEVVFGSPMRSPFHWFGGRTKNTEDGYLRDLRERLKYVRARCRKNNRRAHKNQAEQYDKNSKEVTYAVGQYVYLSDPSVGKGKVKKFHRPWRGPYPIIEVIPPSNLRLQLKFRKTVVHKDRVKLHRGRNHPSETSEWSEERRRGRPRKGNASGIGIVGPPAQVHSLSAPEIPHPAPPISEYREKHPSSAERSSVSSEESAPAEPPDFPPRGEEVPPRSPPQEAASTKERPRSDPEGATPLCTGQAAVGHPPHPYLLRPRADPRGQTTAASAAPASPPLPDPPPVLPGDPPPYRPPPCPYNLRPRRE